MHLFLSDVGRDATLEFDDVGHSEEALALMVPMLVGTYEVR